MPWYSRRSKPLSHIQVRNYVAANRGGDVEHLPYPILGILHCAWCSPQALTNHGLSLDYLYLTDKTKRPNAYSHSMSELFYIHRELTKYDYAQEY